MRGILFLIYLFVEIVITLPFAYAIGVLYTFLEIVFSALIGITVLFNTPFKLQESFQKIAMNRLSLSTVSLASTVRVLGAFLLILPGFFGDMVGTVLLIWSGILLIGDKIANYKNETAQDTKNKPQDTDVIDVEIVDSDK